MKKYLLTWLLLTVLFNGLVWYTINNPSYLAKARDFLWQTPVKVTLRDITKFKQSDEETYIYNVTFVDPTTKQQYQKKCILFKVFRDVPQGQAGYVTYGETTWDTYDKEIHLPSKGP